MSCPVCHAELTPREWAWSHTHPSKWGRWIGIAMMMVGAFTAAIGLLEVTGIA